MEERGEAGSIVELMLVAKVGGTETALAKYDEWKNSGDPQKRPPTFMLSALGYEALGSGKTQEAIRLFARNVKEYPDSADAYDHLGEAYAKAGKRELAIESYKKSLELDPENENGKEWLKKLRAQQ